MSEDVEILKEGIGEKVAMFTFLIFTFIIVNITSFLHGWKLTLIVFTCVPFIIASTALVAKIQSTLAAKELEAYAAAGAVAEEVISGIRTVLAFSGESKESDRYKKRLKPAEITGRMKGLYSGIGAGVMWFFIYFTYGLAVWYGVQMVLEERNNEVVEYTPAVLIAVLFGLVGGSQNLGLSSPHVDSFTMAKGAAKNIFDIIDRKSAIDPMSEEGLKPETVVGDIVFEDVRFRYPSRSEVEVLKGLNLTIKTGQTVAFVGASGCGKSTCLQLFQRMYDPEHGCVRLDGRNIKELNVGWLRSQIGVVGQEPVLFATTIEENIRFGNPSVTQAEIEQACKMANCHSFIAQLPEGYKTMVGEKGAQMSGGQKQRIAIARAMVRNPKILLLDEATSALDPTSERHVQDALEVASAGRTTLIVAHRLSTITNADKIFVIDEGLVVEEGTHKELMARGGRYHGLVNAAKRHEDIQRDFEVGPRRNSSFQGEPQVDEEVTEKFEAKEAKSEFKETYDVSLWQLLKLNAPEWMYLMVGCIAAAIYGITFTAFAIYFGEFYGVMSHTDEIYVRSESHFHALLFGVIGVVSGLATFVQMYAFNMAGVRLTSRLRHRAFKTILSQGIEYFDDQINSVGALCSRLAGDCSSVQGATGSRIGIMVQAGATLLAGLAMSLMLSWKLTLVTLVPIPFTLGSNVLEARYMEMSSRLEKQAEEKAAQVAVEAIANISTISSLCLEKSVLDRYMEQARRANDASIKKMRFRGMVVGFSQASPLLSFGLSLFYGGLLVADGSLEYKTIIKISEALLFGTWMLSQATAYAPNLSAAIVSAGRLMKLFEREVTDSSRPSVQTTKQFDASGDISYENIKFHYPTRKEMAVLEGLNLQIARGTTVALVGPSGCGKSTCIQLLLRYYDPVSGSVKINSTPTTEIPLNALRSQLGLVSQEPVLFDRTIADNIAYGDNFRENIPMTEIIDSAKKSNIHDFIVALPQGYDTPLGSKGAQLSGGQKQRIAIARALVRNPKILVLDEATSALDVQSEKIVQEALDAAGAGRTCITIAQRLTTIRNSDQICVLQKGVIAEQGTHDELMRRNGIYAGLYTMQLVP